MKSLEIMDLSFLIALKKGIFFWLKNFPHIPVFFGGVVFVFRLFLVYGCSLYFVSIQSEYQNILQRISFCSGWFDFLQMLGGLW